MEAFITKQEKKLYKALQTLLTHSVDSIGLPKKATSKQLYKASKALNDYDKYQREHRAQAKQNYWYKYRQLIL